MMTPIVDASELTTWRKSSYSENGGGGCIEVADGFSAVTPVRDSKNPAGPALVVPSAAWSSFVTAVKGENLPAL